MPPINFFANAFSQLPQMDNMASKYGFNMKPRKNPFRALSFEQPQIEEQQTFAQAYPRERLSDYEKFLMHDKPQFERSKGAKIAAALLAGIGGLGGNPNALRDSNAALRAPYEREMEEYEFEGGRLKELSSIEDAKIRAEMQAIQSIRDYEDKIADNNRADLLARNTMRLGDNTLATGEVTRENLRSQIENRGKSLQRNEITGELELVDQNNMSRASLGNFAPSYGQKRTDANADWQMRDDRNFGQQVKLAGIQGGISRSNMLAGKQFDLDNPSPGSLDTLTPSEQKTAIELAQQELLGPNSPYLSLLTEIDTPQGKQKVLQRPQEVTPGIFRSGNAGDLQNWDELYKRFEADLARKISEIENKYRSRGRFEIQLIK